MKIKKIFLTLTLSFMGMLALSGVISTQANAEVWTGNAGGTTSGTMGCKNNGNAFYWSSCFGASWRKYPATSDDIPIENLPGEVVDHVRMCKTYGGEYYRLAYERYNTKTGALAGGQRGLVQVKNIVPVLDGGNGFTVFRKDAGTDMLDWYEVKAKFDLAYEHNATGGKSWPDVSWFCYNTAWEAGEAKSSFDSWSFVDDASTISIGPDQRVTKNISTTEDTVTVKFKHQLSYNKPNVSTDNKFGPAETTWYTEVRENDEYKSGTRKTVFKLTNSGPSRNSVWDDMPSLGESSYTVKVPEEEGAEVTVCSTIFYAAKEIAWKESSPKNYVMDAGSSSGNASSTACAVITRGEKKSESAGHIRFWSKSSVTTNRANDVAQREVSTRDSGDVRIDEYSHDKVALRISTNESSIRVNFSHTIGFVYEDDNNEHVEFARRDRFKQGEKVYTLYDLVRDNAGQQQELISDREYTVVPPLGPGLRSSGNQNISRTDFNITDLKYGETRRVCERVNYDPRIVYLDREEVMKWVDVYEPTGSDTGLGVFIMTPTEDTDVSGIGINTSDELGIFRTASSSDYYHYEPRLRTDEWGNQYWEDVEVAGGKTGLPIYPRDPSVTLYTRALDGVGEVAGKSLYSYKTIKYNWGTDKYGWTYEAEYSYIGGDSAHHWDYNGNIVSGPDEWGYGVASDGGSLYTPRKKEIHDYWLYFVAGTEPDGASEACIEVTRPAPIPTEDSSDDIGSSTNGGSKIGIMYAGQDTAMKWGVQAEAYPTRRIMEWKAVVLQLDVNQNFDNIRNTNALKGNIKKDDPNSYITNKDDPCTYVKNRTGLLLRKDTSGNGLCSGAVAQDLPNNGFPNDGQTHKYTNGNNSGMSVIVPDEVGDKYCTTSGLRWKYWYIIERNDVVVEERPEDGIPNSEYWANYGISCSTIAKKPSVSITNGGIMTNSSVNTSLADRYGDPYQPHDLFGQPVCRGVSSNGVLTGCYSQQTFGSWTEYLASINGSPNHLGSGISLAWFGSPVNNMLKISPLTIQNVSESKIGESGISTKSTTMARLASYFSSDKATASFGELMANASNINGSYIINETGNVVIDRDIIVSNAPVKSIYQLPQVVIYTTGNIVIKPNVKRIDAWLIAGGSIDTCDGWVSGVLEDTESKNNGTEAHVKGYNDRDTTTCANQLVINGPVFAQFMETHRSFGASRGITNDDEDRKNAPDESRAASGEVFNLSADSYLWAYAQAGRYDSSYTEAYSRELPPRY